jgi:hypothetical protein
MLGLRPRELNPQIRVSRGNLKLVPSEVELVVGESMLRCDEDHNLRFTNDYQLLKVIEVGQGVNLC